MINLIKMVKISSKKILFLICILLLGFVSAEFSVGNASHSLQSSYNFGENLSGWINISFSGESLNSTLKSSTGGQIKLENLLAENANSGFDYNCTPKSCALGYSTQEENTSKIFNLISGQSLIFGFKLTGQNELSEITSFKFDLKSNNSESSVSPLLLDILNDGVIEWQAYRSSDNYGSENSGCFVNVEGGVSKAKISSIFYCEKMNLKKAPDVEIGAYVSYLEGGENVSFDMRIENVELGYYKTCTANATGTGRIACNPDFSVIDEGNHYICVKAKNSIDANKYEIGYEQTNPCGFSGTFDGEYSYDFNIFEKSKTYASNINFTLNNTELANSQGAETKIEDYIEEYITETYEDNCKSGCVIPIKINSGVNQTINVSNAKIIYVTGISQETNKFYNLQESPALISSKFQKLDFAPAGFAVPNKKGSQTVSISLNGEELFEQIITVGESPVIEYVNPTKTAIKYSTKFLTKVSSDLNITQYKWNFGDGEAETTLKNEATHTYNVAGNYQLMLTATNSAGRNSSKNFSITVSPASEIVPDLLDKASKDVVTLESNINNFTGFKKISIQNVFNIGNIKDTLLTLKNSESKADTETEYEAILDELLKIKIPLALSETATGQGILFYPERESINLEVLKKISDGDYSSAKEDQYKEAILSWQVENVNLVLSFSEISAIYETYNEPALQIFEMEITKTGDELSYLILEDLENLIFDGDYSIEDYNEYKYIPIDSETKKFSFSTTEDLDFLSLPVFISPSLEDITLPEWSAFDNTGSLKRWILFTIIIIGVLFCTFIVYIALQIWYKRKYEMYLFKNKNNLYNLVNYIKSSRDNGMKNKDIEKNLEKAGWTSEQLRYIMRKFEGKNTGLPEIPIKKILKEKEKKIK